MSYKEMIEAFSDEKKRKYFKRGAKKLLREAKENGYKPTVVGLTTFLNNCGDRIGNDSYNFYQMCIPYATFDLDEKLDNK